MPRTEYDEVFDGQGNLLSRTERTVSDAEIELEEDAANLRALVTLAEKAEREWTEAYVMRAVRLLLRSQLRRELRARL